MTRIHDIPNRAVLITGSRNWQEGPRGVIASVLDSELEKGDFVLIHGDCPTGADYIARMWWMHVGSLGVQHLPMRADWSHGPAAGPNRNHHMVSVLRALRASLYECVVHAFPLSGGAGTRNCMKLAQAAGFQVFNHGSL